MNERIRKSVFVKMWISRLLIAVLLVTVVFPAAVFAQEKALTRGEAVRMICEAADDYHPNLKPGDLISGYGTASAKENQPVTRLETSVMLAKAFDRMEEPMGHNRRAGLFWVMYEDVPEWAEDYVEYLTDRGVLVGEDDETLGADLPVTKSELTTMLHRFYAYIGTNPRDNLSYTVNHKWLNQSQFSGGIFSGGANTADFNALEDRNSVRVKSIISRAAAQSQTKDKDSQKISNFYRAAADKTGRDAAGIEPVRKYLQLADKAKTLDELLAVDAQVDRETGICYLFPWEIRRDPKDGSRAILEYSGTALIASVGDFEMLEDSPKLVEPFKTALQKMLVIGGETPQKARQLAGQLLEMEKELAALKLGEEEYADINKSYHLRTIEELCAEYPGFNMRSALNEFGLSQAKTVNVPDLQLTKKTAELMNDSQLDVWRAVFKVNLLRAAGEYLGGDLKKVLDQLEYMYEDDSSYWDNWEPSSVDTALYMTEKWVSVPIERLYMQAYVPASLKDDVGEMTTQLVAAFKDRLKKNAWLSAPTREMAIKKLDAMKVEIAWPDRWSDTVDLADIRGPESGGSLFGNVSAITKVLNQQLKASLNGKPMEQWKMPIYAVNAYYSLEENKVIIPAGILQAPYFDEKAKPEVNLAGAGTVIAHEITHAFDNLGAAYDENGNFKDWWTQEDYERFRQKCAGIAAFYSGVELAPGICNDGEFTMSENVADLGGLACVLEAAKKLPNPDYKALFTNYAVSYRISEDRYSLQYLAEIDVHTNGLLRTNLAAMNFEEFYKTYGVKAGDGMYLAPAERVAIW